MPFFMETNFESLISRHTSSSFSLLGRCGGMIRFISPSIQLLPAILCSAFAISHVSDQRLVWERHYCDRLKKASSFCLVKPLVLIRLKRLNRFVILKTESFQGISESSAPTVSPSVIEVSLWNNNSKKTKPNLCDWGKVRALGTPHPAARQAGIYPTEGYSSSTPLFSKELK